MIVLNIGLAVVVVSVGWPAKPSVFIIVPVELAVIALTVMRILSVSGCSASDSP